MTARYQPHSDMDRDWPAVAASCIGLIFSIGTLTVYTFGVFVHPLVAEFGWSRTEVSGALSVSQYSLALSAPFWGTLIDRFGQRAILLIAIAMLSLLLASLSLLTPNIWHYYLVFGGMSFLAAGAGPLGYSAVLVDRFEGRLGLALGLALMGVGLGAAILPPLAQAFIAALGWRGAYAALGALTFAVTLPAVLLATRRVETQKTATPGRHSAPNPETLPSIAPMIRSRAFLLMCIIFLFFGIITVGTLAHLVPMLTDRGLPAADAAWIASLMGFLVIVTRGGIGWVLDRIHAPYVVAAIAVFATSAFFLLAYGQTAIAFYVASMFLGAVLGSEVDFISFLARRYFDRAAFGRLYGIAFASFMVGAGSGPLILGASYDRLGGYQPGLFAFATMSVVVFVLAIAMPPYVKRDVASEPATVG